MSENPPEREPLDLSPAEFDLVEKGGKPDGYETRVLGN